MSSTTATRPRLLVAGATGLTGNAVAHGLAAAADVELAACVAPSLTGVPTRKVPESIVTAARVDDVAGSDVDVLVDFSVAEAVADHLTWCLQQGVHALIGTTGLPDGLLDEMAPRFEAAGLGLLYAPNFSIGAVLSMQFAAEMARWFPSVEIIETHRAEKRDAPSGTAIRTAELVAAARSATDGTVDGAQQPSARGDDIAGVAVHSVRLHGAVAHQEIVAAGDGQMLTVRHDALDRSCYASGVAAAAQTIHDHPGLTIGLEQLL